MSVNRKTKSIVCVGVSVMYTSYYAYLPCLSHVSPNSHYTNSTYPANIKGICQLIDTSTCQIKHVSRSVYPRFASFF